MSGSGRMTVEVARRLLAVGPGADAETLRAARNRAVMTAHPDHGGAEDDLRDVLEAYKVLAVWLGFEAAGDEDRAPAEPRLDITPAIAINGGRQITRLPDGRKIAIVLPAGLRVGDKVSAGGLHLTVAITGRPELFVSGDDLCMVVKASANLMANGGRVKIKTPAGACLVWIPKQVGTNRIVRVLGRGLPPRGKHRQGALILKLAPEGEVKDTAAKTKRKRFGGAWAAA
jgi:curved DNA-binding protein